ncbi:hypothetical protein [Paenibacillus sp. OV219]|uniref:hypothetical protein n=1 Tax=Paenibacillus sp. OV219 TaxID=1884377 RepID=UPI0015A69DDB|nr:hypothetical protein [Paenibacillus sp. OV219]
MPWLKHGDITDEQANQKKQAALKEVEDFIDHTQTIFEMKAKRAQGEKKEIEGKH